ncbi:MAG: Tad domain-containing protein [Aeromicrobium sp.]
MTTRRERGSASIFVIGMSIVLLVCAGLVVDGGLAINARMRLADDAEQAARAGADSINIDLLRKDGAIAINEGEARRRAAGYLAERGYGTYEVDFDGNAVVVHVTGTSRTTLLKLVNIPDFAINAEARAEPETEPD